MTRRMLIERLGAVGGAALMMAGMEAFGYGIASARNAPPKLEGSGAGKKLVILGAGVAGLATAIEAMKAGYEVQIVEARCFAGGRAQTARKGVTITELGGEAQTVAGLCGLGDLVLTCSSPQSRNMSVGLALGQGQTLEQALSGKLSVAEGVASAPALKALAAKLGVETPICSAVENILAGTVDVATAIEALLSRPIRAETL